MNASRIPRLPLVVAPLLLAPLAAFVPAEAGAQTILKCNGPDGTTIFTDKSCEAFGATLEKDFAFEGADNAAPGELREAPATITDQGVVGGGFGINGCARTRGELIAGVRESISRGDVNRLANYYDWAGMGTSAAFATMERLDKIARNTMAAVAYDYPQPTYDYALPAYASATPEYTVEGDTTASLSAAVAMAAAVAYQDTSSTFSRYREENDDVAFSAGVIDASTPLGGARAMTMANVSGGGYHGKAPSAMRVNLGGGTGHRLGVRENRGCWFVTF